ncbi:hypothetical protein HPB50_006781 [Hyalomma asiaticum]|uniref:Uncharacterized protein n=1 Tax=Hyalomma asiaticum TaxID=266040 RepID=A0ACB7SWE0_HYAAI|nr:hypothetical protein HPB50_006781 [Hyalomma asiaticum]
MMVGLALLLVMILAPTTSLARGGPRKLRRATPDAFEIFSRFPNVVAISDWNDDAFFECLSGKRIDFDPDTRETTYIFMYKGHRGAERANVAYHISQAPSQNHFFYYLDNDTEKKRNATLHYTDYTTCNIIQGAYHGDQCMLFVTKQAADNVTEDCIEQYNDICGASFSLYSRDLCADGEEDY